MSRYTGRIACSITVLLLLADTSLALPFGQSFLILTAHPADQAFDSSRQILYISKNSGIERYDLAGKQFLQPYTVPYAQPNPVDLSPDGRYLYVAGYPGGANPVRIITQIDTTNGSQHQFVSNGSAGTGNYDLVYAANGKVFFTNSNIDYLRQLDPATGQVIPRTDAPPSNYGSRLNDQTTIAISGNRNLLMFSEGNTSRPTNYTYNVVTDTFSPALSSDGLGRASINRNGTLIATGSTIRDPNLQPLHLLFGLTAVAFDPLRDILYAWDSGPNNFVGLDTNTWSELFHFPIGDSIQPSNYYGPGRVTISSDSRYLFLAVEDGIRAYSIVPEPSAALILGLGWAIVSGRCRC